LGIGSVHKTPTILSFMIFPFQASEITY